MCSCASVCVPLLAVRFQECWFGKLFLLFSIPYASTHIWLAILHVLFFMLQHTRKHFVLLHFPTHTHMHIHASKRIERVLHTHTHIICIENPLAWKCNRDLVASNIWSNKNYNNNSKATGMWIAFAFSMRQKSVFHFRCSVHVFVWPAKRAKGVRRSDEGEWRAHSFIWHSTA